MLYDVTNKKQKAKWEWRTCKAQVESEFEKRKKAMYFPTFLTEEGFDQLEGQMIVNYIA